MIKIISPIVNFFDNFFKFLNIRKKNLTIKNIYKKNLIKEVSTKIKSSFWIIIFVMLLALSMRQNSIILIITCDGKGDDACHKSFVVNIIILKIIEKSKIIKIIIIINLIMIQM